MAYVSLLVLFVPTLVRFATYQARADQINAEDAPCSKSLLRKLQRVSERAAGGGQAVAIRDCSRDAVAAPSALDARETRGSSGRLARDSRESCVGFEENVRGICGVARSNLAFQNFPSEKVSES